MPEAFARLLPELQVPGRLERHGAERVSPAGGSALPEAVAGYLPEVHLPNGLGWNTAERLHPAAPERPRHHVGTEDLRSE
jgi:hypothetical protein